MGGTVDWRELRINGARLRADLDALGRIGRDGEGALDRPVFSPAYEEARAWLKVQMAAAGLTATDDGAGNCFGRLGPAGPCVMAGSHIDTVPDGGPLDGAYGVLAALECARVMAAAGIEAPRAFEVAAFADEEGRYVNFMGSLALAGRLDGGALAAAGDGAGRPLAEIMAAAGFDMARAEEAVRAPGEIAAYVELHIEQGPVLEAMDVPIGVVEAIVAGDRADFRFAGEPDHAGTTPMDLRKDAFMAAASFAVAARARVLAEGDGSTRLTYGIIEAKPQVTNIVPYRVRLRQEIRDVRDDRLDRLVAGTRALAETAAAEHGVGVEFTPLARTSAAAMAPRIRRTIAEAAEALGLGHHAMPSGAGHDAQIVAAVAEAGMIFVPSEGGRSHRRDERTAWPLLEQGANVLLGTVLRLLHAAA